MAKKGKISVRYSVNLDDEERAAFVKWCREAFLWMAGYADELIIQKGLELVGTTGIDRAFRKAGERQQAPQEEGK